MTVSHPSIFHDQEKKYKIHKAQIAVGLVNCPNCGKEFSAHAKLNTGATVFRSHSDAPLEGKTWD